MTPSDTSDGAIGRRDCGSLREVVSRGPIVPTFVPSSGGLSRPPKTRGQRSRPARRLNLLKMMERSVGRKRSLLGQRERRGSHPGRTRQEEAAPASLAGSRLRGQIDPRRQAFGSILHLYPTAARVVGPCRLWSRRSSTARRSGKALDHRACDQRRGEAKIDGESLWCFNPGSSATSTSTSPKRQKLAEAYA